MEMRSALLLVVAIAQSADSLSALRVGPRPAALRRRTNAFRGLALAQVGRLSLDAHAPAPNEAEHNDLFAHATQYFGAITVGGSEFSAIFDCGSPLLLLPGNECQDGGCASQGRRRLPSDAKQIAWADEPLKVVSGDDTDNRDVRSIQFATGEASGHFERAQVCVGAAKQSGLCAEMNYVALEEESDEPFKDALWDGVLGLSMSGIGDGPEFSLLTRLGAKDGAKPAMAGMYFRDVDMRARKTPATPAEVPASAKFADGEVRFGSLNSKLFEPESLFFVPISTPGYWQFAIADVQVGGESLRLCAGTKNGCQGVVDSGSSLLMAPQPMLTAISDKIDLDDSCSRAAPDIDFIVKDGDGKERVLSLSKKDYIDLVENSNSPSAPADCFLQLMASPDTGRGPLIVFGYPIMRKFYTVLDEAEKRVGFATAVVEPPEGAIGGGGSVKLFAVRP